MKNSQKGFLVPLLIIIVAVAAIGGGVYYFTHRESSEMGGNTQTNLQGKIVGETYTNDVADFSISIPKGWIVVEESWSKNTDAERGTKATGETVFIRPVYSKDAHDIKNPRITVNSSSFRGEDLENGLRNVGVDVKNTTVVHFGGDKGIGFAENRDGLVVNDIVTGHYDLEFSALESDVHQYMDLFKKVSTTFNVKLAYATTEFTENQKIDSRIAYQFQSLAFLMIGFYHDKHSYANFCPNGILNPDSYTQPSSVHGTLRDMYNNLLEARNATTQNGAEITCISSKDRYVISQVVYPGGPSYCIDNYYSDYGKAIVSAVQCSK